METTQVVMILSCNEHIQTIRQILEAGEISSWMVLSGEQARRAGRLQYTPLRPSTSPHAVFAFADRASADRILTALRDAVHGGSVCPTCLAFTWEAVAALSPSAARDPVCGQVTDRERAPRKTFRGTTYSFCSTACQARFERDPEAYA